MAKMKLKTHSGAKKRFKLTKNGKIKRGHAFRSHILTKKTTKLTRGYRQPSYVDKTNAATIKSMRPYAYERAAGTQNFLRDTKGDIKNGTYQRRNHDPQTS